MSWLKPNLSGKKGRQALETTVTFLEMDTPCGIVAHRPANINAALLSTNDIPLHFYRYLYFHVGIHWNWESRLRLSDDKLTAQIHSPDAQIAVLYVDGAPAGFYEINTAQPQITDLAYFGMMPHVFGKGLGRWFLAAAIEACWATEPRKVTVNTCTLDHPAALPLYQKMGFKPYKQSRGHIRPLSDGERANLAAISGIAP